MHDYLYSATRLRQSVTYPGLARGSANAPKTLFPTETGQFFVFKVYLENTSATNRTTHESDDINL